MGVKQIPTHIFLAYLESLGLVFIRNKGTSHHQYDFPDGHPHGKLSRPLSVWTKEKEIPITHIHTNLKTIDPVNGKKNFEVWLNNYRLGKKK